MLAMAVPASAGQPTSPEDVASRIETFYKDRADVRATFVQKVKKPGRRRVLEKSGRVFFKRPGKMRWDYQKPEQVFYISDGEVLWSYQPEDRLATRLDVKSSQLYHQTRYLFGQGNLASDFNLVQGKAAPKGLYALELQPRKSSKTFSQLTLMVDLETGEIRQSVLVDPYGNESTIIFGKVKYADVEDKHFQFTPPATATVRNLNQKP